jgi:HlyD family secretion protein
MKRNAWSRRLALGGACLLALSLAACGGKKEAEEPAQAAQLVTAATVEPRSFDNTVPVSGEVRPVRDIQVFAPISGVRIVELLADEGDTVKAGQPLARLEAGVAQAQQRAAQAAAQEAEVDRLRTQAEYARAQAIADSGAISREAIEARRAAAEAAAARADAQQAQAAEVAARLAGGYVRAPAAGLVIKRMAVLGALADQQALFRIAGDNRLEVAAEVSEGDVLALERGMTARFRLGENDVVQATLRRAPAAIDSDTRTGEALFALPRDGRVRAGMFLRGEAVAGTQTLLAAPVSAVSYAGAEPTVFRLVDGVAKRTPVVLGPRSGSLVALLKGVQAGELIAVEGGAFLEDGAPVRIAEDPAAVAAAGAGRG